MTPPGRLSAVFLASGGAGDGGGARDASAAAALEAALGVYLEAARAVLPALPIDTETFIRYVAARAAGKLPAASYAGDLLLACGCTLGVPMAVESFHDRYRSVIARVLARRRAQSDLADDVSQLVFERLLVGTSENPPKIADYKGIGPLRSWVSTAAATTLLMFRRAAGRRPDQLDDTGTVSALETASPELLYMKERYKAEIGQAIVGALDRLDDRQRTLLRLHLGERMTIDQLGALYRVNRATAARWVAAAREALVDHARASIRAALRLSDSQYDSLAALVRSEIDLSLVRHLAPDQG